MSSGHECKGDTKNNRSRFGSPCLGKNVSQRQQHEGLNLKKIVGTISKVLRGRNKWARCLNFTSPTLSFNIYFLKCAGLQLSSNLT